MEIVVFTKWTKIIARRFYPLLFLILQMESKIVFGLGDTNFS